MTGIINAQPSLCYAALADYRVAHPYIVPPRYFAPLVVERGGFGAGTRIASSLKVMGQLHPFTSDITEPVPGRIIVETVAESGIITTFTVAGDGEFNARVTIESKLPRGSGIRGVLERLVNRRLFPRIFAEELERLANYVSAVVVGSPQVLLDG